MCSWLQSNISTLAIIQWSHLISRSLLWQKKSSWIGHKSLGKKYLSLYWDGCIEDTITGSGKDHQDSGILPVDIPCQSNQEASSSDISSPLHPAAARLQPLYWPAGWRTQWVARLMLAKSDDLPPVRLLDKWPSTGRDGPVLRALLALFIKTTHMDVKFPDFKLTSNIVPYPG